MKPFKLWIKLLFRQWSWYNDKVTVIFQIVISMIIAFCYTFSISVMFTPVAFAFFIYLFSVYMIFKFIVMSIICALVVFFIDDRRMQIRYAEMYNWRQNPKKHVNIDFN